MSHDRGATRSTVCQYRPSWDATPYEVSHPQRSYAPHIAGGRTRWHTVERDSDKLLRCAPYCAAVIVRACDRRAAIWSNILSGRTPNAFDRCVLRSAFVAHSVHRFVELLRWDTSGMEDDENGVVKTNVPVCPVVFIAEVSIARWMKQ